MQGAQRSYILIAIPIFSQTFYKKIPIFVLQKSNFFLKNSCFPINSGYLEVSCDSTLQNYFCSRILHVNDHMWVGISLWYDVSHHAIIRSAKSANSLT